MLASCSVGLEALTICSADELVDLVAISPEEARRVVGAETPSPATATPDKGLFFSESGDTTLTAAQVEEVMGYPPDKFQVRAQPHTRSPARAALQPTHADCSRWACGFALPCSGGGGASRLVWYRAAEPHFFILMLSLPRSHPSRSSAAPVFLPSLFPERSGFSSSPPSLYSQVDCLEVITHESHDLLAMAPTGSGKTAVALCAILQAFRRGKKAVYTSPIKVGQHRCPHMHEPTVTQPSPHLNAPLTPHTFGWVLKQHARTHATLLPSPAPIPPPPCPQALSNQKYAEFKAWFSKRGLRAGVALLTGDIKIRSPPGTSHELIICTSEILRNKLVKSPHAPPPPPNTVGGDPASSSLRDLDLDNLGVVVSDEIHYINDAERGTVWEETLMHLPPDVQVCASRPAITHRPLAPRSQYHTWAWSGARPSSPLPPPDACSECLPPPCLPQMVALSATLREPEHFLKWIEKARGRPGKIIKRTDRHVPLHVRYGTATRQHTTTCRANSPLHHHTASLHEPARETATPPASEARLAWKSHCECKWGAVPQLNFTSIALWSRTTTSPMRQLPTCDPPTASPHAERTPHLRTRARTRASPPLASHQVGGIDRHTNAFVQFFGTHAPQHDGQGQANTFQSDK
jgi:hypothetical protein